MTYTIRRFSWTEESHSIISHEDTVNGKTTGEVKVSRGKHRSGHKPVHKSITLRYHDKL